MTSSETHPAPNDWESVFNTIGSAIWLLDSEFRIKRANKAAEELFHLPSDQLAGRHCWEIVHETAQPISQCPAMLARTTKRRESFEMQLGGQWLEVVADPILDENGGMTGCVHTVNEITPRRAIEFRLKQQAMEERIRESEEKYRSLFQGSKAAVLVIDPVNGNILDANDAAAKYYGYDFALPPGKNIAEINTLSADRIYEEMAKASTEKREYFHFSHRLANGEVRPVEVYSGPIRLNGRDLLYSIVHDISERKRMEEEKETLINELREALARVKTLSGLLPICSSCKKIRNDDGYWTQIELYIQEHSLAEFSHGLCPECIKKLYPGYL